MPDLSNHRALITGASSGIGAEIAKILASWKCDLVLVARRADRLEALTEELRGEFGVTARHIACDLAEPGAAATVHGDVVGAGEDIDILVNNAGFGAYQAFEHLEWERQARMIQLNVTALVELCHRFLPAMRARDRRCYMLNVASIAAYQPVPYFATYAASKSFVRDFTEALARELVNTNVSATSVCPGGTWTEFMDHSGQTLGTLARASMMDARKVALIGLRAMLRRRRNIVAGFSNALMCFLMRLLPRRVAAAGSVAVLGAPAPARAIAGPAGAIAGPPAAATPARAESGGDSEGS